MVAKRTLRGWFEYLNDDKREMTEMEFITVMVFNTREYSYLTLKLLQEMKAAAEHTEGMLGAIDQLAAGLAEQAAIPYASSAAVREALDARRDELRRLAEQQRAAALNGANTDG